MRHLLLALTLSFILVITAGAQQISGVIHDERGKPVNGSTVSLLRAGDSSVVKLSLSKEGRYGFSDIPTGSYRVSASHVGYETRYSDPFVLSHENIALPLFILRKAAGDLKGVTVVARKPIVQVKDGKTVLNVEGTVNSVGSDALDLLRKAPGVAVDKDDNLSIQGKNGVKVLIDGRPTPLTAQELSNYLKTVSSAQIESIEIIGNPGGSYEAAGNAGVINIRLKKNRMLGTNGTVNGGWNRATYAKYSAGVSLNHRNRKVNLFGSYNYSHGLNKNNFNLYRVVLDTSFDQRNKILIRNNSHSFKGGADYFINSKNTVGVLVHGTLSDPDVTNSSVTPIAYAPTKTVDRLMVSDNRSVQKYNNINVNANYSYADTSGKSLSLNADYGRYDIRYDQLQPNYFYDPSGVNELYRTVYQIITPTTIDIYSLKADWEQKLGKGKLGIGGKLSSVTTDNDLQQYDVYASGKELDHDRSNRFRYKEDIRAGYITYNRAFNGVLIQAGLRAEHTSLEGTSKGMRTEGGTYVDYRTTFTRNYLDWFPSASVTFNKNPKNVVGFTYSRRIDRPVYQDLNPFEYKVNEYTFHKGSIDLRPQYTSSFGVTHTYNYKLNTSLNYSHVKDMIGQVVDTTEGTRGYLSNRNLASQDITSLTVSYPFRYKAYSVFANVNTYYSRYQADYGPGRVIDKDILAVSFYAQNTLRFAGTWTAEISGFYTSPTIWQGSLRSKAMWSIDGGVQKQVWQGKGTLKLSVSDLFRSMKWEASNYFAGQYTRTNATWESRQVKLGFTYRFGNSQVKSARQRSTGTEEESKRVQTGGGGGLGH
jgi:iron complex outermembrane recepter protein